MGEEEPIEGLNELLRTIRMRKEWRKQMREAGLLPKKEPEYEWVTEAGIIIRPKFGKPLEYLKEIASKKRLIEAIRYVYAFLPEEDRKTFKNLIDLLSSNLISKELRRKLGDYLIKIIELDLEKPLSSKIKKMIREEPIPNPLP